MKNLFLLIVLILLNGCITTGNMRKEYVDPTGVKTIEEPTGSTVGSSAAENTASSQKLKTKVALLQGQIEELEMLHKQEMEYSKEQLEAMIVENQQLKVLLEKDSKKRTTTDTKKAASLLWAAAVKDIEARSYSQAIPLLKQIIDSYPRDKHVYYSHLATAMCLYAMKKYQSSAGAFAYVTRTYPKNNNIEMAWYGQGAALYKMLKGKESLLFFKQVRSRWPKSDEGQWAAKIMVNKAQPPVDLFLAFPSWLREAPGS